MTTAFASIDMSDATIVVVIILLRLLVPLLIPKYPLAIIAALVIDAVDQTILQLFTNINTSETGLYQSYDKAMDIYYLAIAYLSTMRNWTSEPAFKISKFLFYYRLIGVTLFELTGLRWLLLVFPNTFEYFFIAYEVIRLRYDTAKRSARFWLITAAMIWIFIKLPQEYWIHIAQLDFTDTVRNNPWFGIAIVVGLITLVVSCWLLRKRLPPKEHPLNWAADALPRKENRSFSGSSARTFLSTELLEKIVLLGLMCVIFSQFLPNVEVKPWEMILGVSIVVSANTLISTVIKHEGGHRVRSGVVRFSILVALNLVLVLVTAALIGLDRGELGIALFFAYLISLVLWLYDYYRPIHDLRRAGVAKSAV